MNIGEECHIISKKKDGPRHLTDYREDFDDYKNLILLCRNHHVEIDTSIPNYPVDKLYKLKDNHEKWVKNSTDELKLSPVNSVEFPSFNRLIIPKQFSTNADKFYDGFLPQLEDLMSNFDFPRNLYLKKRGIKSTINEFFSSDGVFTKFIAIKGTGGSGKSTLLKRIGFDLSAEGKTVFILNKDWIEDKQLDRLQTQLKRIAEKFDNCVIIIDDVADCILKEEINFITFTDLLKSKKILFVLADQPDRWNKIFPKVRELASSSVLSQYDLHQLDEIECENLADKMIELEHSMQLSIRHRNLTRQERIDICKENSKRHFVVAMLQIRYGMRFSDIIIEEFEKIPSEIGKEAYLMICFCNKLHLNVPESILIESLNLSNALSFSEISSHTEGLIIHNQFGLSSRHPIIAREVYRNFITTRYQVHFYLKKIFAASAENKKEVYLFLSTFLSQENIHKTFVRLLEKDVELIEELIQLIYKNRHFFDKGLLISLLSFHGMIEKILGNDERAIGIFKQIIIDVDKEYSFAYRQIAWIEHYKANYEESAIYAIAANNYSGENPDHILQIAKILSLNTVKYFREAKKYFKSALVKSNYDSRYQEEFDKYCEAEHSLDYFAKLYDDDFIPDAIIRVLRPGLGFFRIHFKSSSREFKNKLISTLHSMESDTTGSIEDLEEVVEGFDIRQDKLVSSKYYGNLARLMYLQWYKNEALLNPQEILGIFLKSLTLNPNDPFTHCWAGTYYKEIERNINLAESHYRKAIELSKRSKYDYDKDHPLFSNNLALLLMDEVISKKIPPKILFEAKSLLDFSININITKGLNFFWAEHNLSKCLDLINRLIPPSVQATNLK